MTSDQDFQQAEADFEASRERFKTAVYGRIETMIRDEFPSATGYEGAAELDDGEQYVSVSAILDPSVDGGKRTYDDLDDEFLEALNSVVTWLDVVDPSEWYNGFEHRWDA